jgi:hypothetical protein
VRQTVKIIGRRHTQNESDSRPPVNRIIIPPRVLPPPVLPLLRFFWKKTTGRKQGKNRAAREGESSNRVGVMALFWPAHHEAWRSEPPTSFAPVAAGRSRHHGRVSDTWAVPFPDRRARSGTRSEPRCKTGWPQSIVRNADGRTGGDLGLGINTRGLKAADIAGCAWTVGRRSRAVRLLSATREIRRP